MLEKALGKVKADPDCCGKLGPNGVTCCDKDACCPAGGTNNLVKGKCDSPSGTDNPDTEGYTYTCYWKPYKYNSDCVDGACCGSSSAGGPGGAIEGKCVGRGIYSNNPKWLCDPPEWNSGIEAVSEKSKGKNIFDMIFAFFPYFFQR